MNTRLIDTSLIVIAVVVVVANYEGLCMTLNASSLWDHGFAALTAFAVGFTVLVFWHTAFEVVPHLRSAALRAAGWATTFAGAGAVLFFSAWWTITALGGDQARLSGFQAAVSIAEERLAAVTAASGEFLSLVPRIDALSAELVSLAACEREGGCITSGSGAGGVEAFLSQLGTAAAGIADAARAGEETITTAGREADACLETMRTAIGSTGEAGTIERDLSAGVDCYNTALGKIAAVDGGTQMQRALGSFADGLVVPVSVASDRQKEAVARIIESIRTKTGQIASIAEPFIENGSVSPIAIPRQNAMQAVWAYWHTIIPAVATAISLDLAPLILLLFRAIIVAGNRARPDDAVLDWRVSELVAARTMLDELPRSRAQPRTIEGRPG